MTDRYQVIRDALPILIAEAQEKGGRNERAALVVELLEERDTLLADRDRLRDALKAERERCVEAVREVAEGYRSTKWGKAAESIGDNCIDAIRRVRPGNG